MVDEAMEEGGGGKEWAAKGEAPEGLTTTFRGRPLPRKRKDGRWKKKPSKNSQPLLVCSTDALVCDPPDPQRFSPEYLDFFLQLLEFRVSGDQLALMVFRQGGGKTIGVGQSVPGIEGGRLAGEINDGQQASWIKTIEVIQQGNRRGKQMALFPADQALPKLACEAAFKK